LNRLPPYARATIALATVAIIAAGCADSRMASNNTASSQGTNQGEQPYKTGYGFTSDGPTTDLYTEFFGPRKTEAAPATAAATTQQMQPMTASTATQPAPPATAATRQAQPATATAATRQVQPAAPVQVAQQPAAPQPPPEPDVPTAYGITANGPTTDLYTELFGPRRRDGQ